MTKKIKRVTTAVAVAGPSTIPTSASPSLSPTAPSAASISSTTPHYYNPQYQTPPVGTPTWQQQPSWPYQPYGYPQNSNNQPPGFVGNPYTQAYQPSPVATQHYPPKPSPAVRSSISYGYANISAKPRIPSPPPSPQPAFHQHWDEIIVAFFTSLGFTQALRGFALDMLVVNEDWQRTRVPPAIEDLVRSFALLGQVTEKGVSKSNPLVVDDDEMSPPDEIKDPKEEEITFLEQRKLSYVHPSNGSAPRTQTSITKDISKFLAENRAKNDASNRNEFLQSIARKRQRVDSEDGTAEMVGSCARTDAKSIDRDVQMKYDVAKNEEGPLSRTTIKPSPSESSQTPKTKTSTALPLEGDSAVTAEKHPGLDERLKSIEAHISVRYVPTPPASLMSRLKFLEDHIVRLEKDYPPWAAVHFTQPGRGWPPAPTPTPIIVPSHLRGSEQLTAFGANYKDFTPTETELGKATNGSISAAGRAPRHTSSSLHRAVMEKLEVKRAQSTLGAASNGIS